MKKHDPDRPKDPLAGALFDVINGLRFETRMYPDAYADQLAARAREFLAEERKNEG